MTVLSGMALAATLAGATPRRERGSTASAACLYAAFAQGVTPAADLKVSEWSDQRRILPSTSSSEPGPWRTDRFPYTREIMEELSPSSSREEIAWMAAAQVAKTECMINGALYVADWDPCPLLYVGPTIEITEKFSKQRLAPSIAEIPSLRQKIADAPKGRDSSSNTIMVKTFPGGAIMLAGANSAAALRSMPIRFLELDEVDSYPADLDDEGDPVSLARARTSNFRRRKIFYASTPKLKETSRIEALFDSGDQRFYHIPCPFCGMEQTLIFGQLRWTREKGEGDERGEPHDIHYECIGCKAKIEEHHKTKMLAAGRWIAKYPGRHVASFHLNSLYSPLGFLSWTSIVREFLTATDKRDKNLMQAFVNTRLGETFSVTEGKEFDVKGLAATRPEPYPCEVPMGALFLTCGVDVQKDRLEYEVIGWGKDEECWHIEYRMLLGDPQLQAVWIELDAHLKKAFRHESGADLGIACTLIDSGDQSHVVYQFCADKAHRRIFPSKGQDGFGRGFYKKSTGKVKGSAYLFLLMVDEIKTRVYSHLKLDTEGPGYCHFPERPEYNENYFRGLTSETLVPRKTVGGTKLRWTLPKGRRNEPLDIAVLNLGACHIITPSIAPLIAGGKPYSPKLTEAAGARKKRGLRVVSRGTE